MSVGIQVWSQTASANSTIDTNINWAEGMAPSQVNDSARALMASAAKWRDDNNGTIVTGGSTTAFTATTSQVESALTAGYTVAIQFNATADTSATLAVDGLAAKPLQIVAGTNLKGGEFTAGDICRFTYSTTGTGQWIANGPQAYIQNNNQLASAIVNYANIQNVTASRLLGNPTGSPAAPSEITLGTNLTFSGTTLNAGNNTPVISVFTSTAAATWQSTTQNGNFPLYLLVRMVGGGGGGGAVNTNNGSSGTDTSFSNWTAVGGGKGLNSSSGTGGTGGSGGTNGTGTVIRRISGSNGMGAGAGTATAGGYGGGNPLGPGGPGAASTGGLNGVNATTNTGGGGGGGQSGNAGGGGGGGAEYVEFIITSPSTAYNYTVGAGGAGGSAGGQSGGNGAAGRIEVIAYWQ